MPRPYEGIPPKTERYQHQKELEEIQEEREQRQKELVKARTEARAASNAAWREWLGRMPAAQAAGEPSPDTNDA